MNNFTKQCWYAVGFVAYCIIAVAIVVADGGQLP